MVTERQARLMLRGLKRDRESLSLVFRALNHYAKTGAYMDDNAEKLAATQRLAGAACDLLMELDAAERGETA